MKQNGAVYNLDSLCKRELKFETFYEDPLVGTPLDPDAITLSNEEKIRMISGYFKEIMKVLGLDLTDDSLKETPNRVAKMYVQEFFSGLDPANKPQISLFDNKYEYRQMIIEKNISFHSTCEHHFVPIIGKAHIAYISSGKVIGLSKLNRIVRYFAQRPQVQERLTLQIACELQSVLKTEDVAIIINANHLCVAARGIKDAESTMVTSEYGGVFKDHNMRNEFMGLIR